MNKVLNTSGILSKLSVPFQLFIVSVLSVLFLNANADAQLKNKELTLLNENKQFFYADPLVFYSADSSKARVDLYLEVPMENLQFKWFASKNAYESAADFDIVITNSSKEVVARDAFTNIISNTKQEHKKLTSKSEFITKHYFLPSGSYEMNIAVRDNNTQSEHSKNLNLTVSDYTTQEVAVSNIMFVSNFKDGDNGKKSITPLVNTNIGSLSTFYLFFEIYNNNDYLVKKVLSYKVLDEKNKEVIEGRFDYLLEPGVNQKVEKISTKDLLLGDYKIEVTDAVTMEQLTAKEFNFQWEGMPTNGKDLDLAINQAIYIATTDEFDSMREAKTSEDKQRSFLKFWKSKDPSPNTSKNEMMIEYYTRVKVANERYSHYFDGWKSDMGMVYIMYGDPTSIERYPFSANSKPYEVWDYYDVNRRFVFVDNTGFGDYRLTTPIWDQERSRAY